MLHTLRLRLVIGIISVLGSFQIGTAQLANLDFSASQGNYIEVLGGTLIASGANLDGQFYPATSDFALPLGTNAPTSTVANIHINGFVSNPSLSSSTTNPFVASGNINVWAAFGADLKGKSTSTLRVLKTGVSPNRVYTVQWKDFYINGQPESSVSFQIRFFEGTGEIRFIYGNCIINTASNVAIGLRRQTADLHVRHQTNGDWLASTLSTTATDLAQVAPSSISSGLTYSFRIPEPSICEPPPQLTSVNLINQDNNTLNVGFVAPPGNNGVLVLTTRGAQPNEWPIQGQTYITGDSIGNSRVSIITNTTSIIQYFNTPPAEYTVTFFPYRNLNCSNTIAYQTGNPLSLTAFVYNGRNYFFQPSSGTQSLNSASNWLPIRTTPSNGDTLSFYAGGNVVLEMPSTNSITASRLHFGNGGTYQFTGSNKLLSAYQGIQIDTLTTVRLSFENTGTLTIFNAAIPYNLSSSIRGTLIYENASLIQQNSSNAKVEVYGTIQQLGPFTAYNVTNVAADYRNIIFHDGSVYHHNRDGGNVLQARFERNSMIRIEGITSQMPFFPDSLITGHVEFNIPNNIVTMFNLNGAIDTCLGNFKIASIGGPNNSFNYIGSAPTDKTIMGDLILDDGIFITSSVLQRSIHVHGNVIVNNTALKFPNTSFPSLVAYSDFIQNPNNTLSSLFTGSTAVFGIAFRGDSLQTLRLNGTSTGATLWEIDNPQGVYVENPLLIKRNGGLRIRNGGIVNDGILQYEQINTSLFYESNANSGRSNEWPDNQGPKKVIFNLNSGIRFQLNKECIVDTLTLTAGSIVLNDHHLTVNKQLTFTQANPTDTARLFIQNGLGRYKSLLSTSTTPYSANFPIGFLDVNNQAVSRTVYLTIQENLNPRTMYWECMESKFIPAGDTSMLVHWKVYDTGNGAGLKCAMSLTMPSNALPYNNVSYYPFIYTNQFIPIQGNIGNRISIIQTDYSGIELNEAVLGLQFRSDKWYTWTGAVNSFFDEPLNWNPVRWSPAAEDNLVFNDGLEYTITNTPQQIIRSLHVLNQTRISMDPKLTTDGQLTLMQLSKLDGDSLQLHVSEGSRLSLLPVAGEKWIWRVGSGKMKVSGTLQITNANDSVRMDARTTRIEFDSTSCLHYLGNYQQTLRSTNNLCRLSGEFIYELAGNSTTIFIPECQKGPGSKFHLKSVQNLAGCYPNYGTGNALFFDNLEFTLPAQNSWCYLGNLFNPIGIDSLIINTTGTGYLTRTAPYEITVNHFIQRGGKFKNTDNFGTKIINIKGNLIQSSGSIESNSTFGTLSSAFAIHLNSNQEQWVQLQPNGINTYALLNIMNPNGIRVLPAHDTLPYFYIGANGILSIQTTNPKPISNIGEVPIHYANTGSLYFRTPNPIDSLLIPDTNGPGRLMIYASSALQKSHTVGILGLNETLDIGPHTLTVSQPQSNALTYVQPHGIVSTANGRLRRKIEPWTPPIDSVYRFPFKVSAFNRTLSLRWPLNTLQNGGYLSVGQINTEGFVDGLIIPIDNNDTLTSRTRGGFIVNNEQVDISGNNIQASISTTGWITALAPSTLRICQSDTTLGSGALDVAVNTSTLNINATEISLINLLEDTLFIGSTEQLIPALYTISSGNWNDPSIWSLNQVPQDSSIAVISPNDSVTITQNALCKNLIIQGQLNLQNDTLNVVSVGTHLNGAYIQTGGYFQIGLLGGGKQSWVNMGLMHLIDGKILLNGSFFNQVAPAQFIQDGGLFQVDPNRFGIAELSTGFVSSTFYSAQCTNVLMNAGILQFIDPPLNNSLLGFGENRLLEFGDQHEIIIGDGVSTDPRSSSTSIFATTSDSIAINKLTFLPTAGLTFRNQFSGSNLNVKGDLSFSGSSGLLNTSNLTVGGHVFIDTLSMIQIASNLNLERPFNQASNQMQWIHGKGLFQPNNSTANSFFRIKINNSNPQGVVWDKGNVSTSFLNLFKGKLILTDSSIISVTNIPSSNPDSWVIGRYIQNLSASVVDFSFPLGDSTQKIPLRINDPNITTTGRFGAYFVPGDHPDISNSPINSNKSLNAYFETFIPPNSSINFSQNAAIILPSLPDYLDANVAEDSLVVSIKNQDQNWFTPNSQSIISNALYINQLNDLAANTFIIGQISNGIDIHIDQLQYSVCSDGNISLTAESNNFYPTNFQWEYFVDNAWIPVPEQAPFANSNNLQLHIENVPSTLDGTLFRCKASMDGQIDYSESTILYVNNISGPVFSTQFTNSGQLCQGDTLSVSLNYNNLPSGSIIKWYYNGSEDPEFEDELLFSKANPAQGDYIQARVVYSNSCLNQSVYYGPLQNIVFTPLVTPMVSINPPALSEMCSGTSLVLNTNSSHTGIDPQYQWTVNGIVQSGTDSFLNYTFTENASVSCVMLSTWACVTENTAYSDTLELTITPIIYPQVNIAGDNPMSVCNGAVLNVSAQTLFAGANPQFQWDWSPNIQNTAGANTSQFSGHIFNQNGTPWLRVAVTGSANCTSTVPVWSDTLFIESVTFIEPTAEISVSPSSFIEEGTLVTFTATLSSGDYEPFYRWIKNGEVVSNASTYITQTLQPNDEVWLALTAYAECSDLYPIESNHITISWITSINAANQSTLSVFPNPFQEGFYLSTTVRCQEMVELLDITGRVVTQINLPANSMGQAQWVSVSEDLPAGVYWLRFAGENTPIQRLVKKGGL